MSKQIPFGELWVGDRFNAFDNLWTKTDVENARQHCKRSIALGAQGYGYIGDTICSFKKEDLVEFVPPGAEEAAGAQAARSVSAHEVTATSATAPKSRFGHHPEPAVDFCIEVELIEAEVTDQRAGMPAKFEVGPRIEQAMQFRVGGDLRALVAKRDLRALETERRVAALEEQARRNGPAMAAAWSGVPLGARR